MKFSLNLIILLSISIFEFEYTNGFSLRSNRPTVNDINIFFYYGIDNQQRSAYKLSNIVNILNHPVFDITKTTTLYVHGYNETQTANSTPYLRKAYSYRTDHNFLTLDYNAFVNENYVTSAFNVPYVAPYVSRALIQLFNAGLPIENVHLVGHSLGGQLSGHIGRNIISQSGGTRILERISGLDPAFPLFYIVELVPPIRATDAKFVDIIHTDAKLYGAPFSTGTVDFWPNGGRSLQPGCPSRTLGRMDANDFCSHWRSWRFWGETVSNIYQNKFIAYKASSYESFKLKSLQSFRGTEITTMGINTPTRVRGNYYLYTNSNEPYAQVRVFSVQ